MSARRLLFAAAAFAAGLVLPARVAHAQAPAAPSTPPLPDAAPTPSDAKAAAPGSQAARPSAEELAAARELWATGMALEKAKDWSGALATFEKVGKVRMTPQVRYHIGLASEQLGKLVDALNAYQLAVQEARIAGDKGRDVAENAPARIEALRVRVARIRLHVVGRIRSSSLLLDGKKLSLALLDQDIPIDPGKHLVEVRRGDVVVERASFELDEGASESIDLKVDDPTASRAASPDPKAGSPDASGEVSRWPAYAAAGLGAALVATGGVFFALREDTVATIRATCRPDDTGCDRDLLATEDLGRAYSTASAVLFGVGGAAVAAGVVLWFVPPDVGGTSESARRGPSPSVGLAPTPGGFVLRGDF